MILNLRSLLKSVMDTGWRWDDVNANKFQCHCLGYARSKDLLQIVGDINSRTLYPAHTEHPDIYRRTVKNIMEVVEGRQYLLS
jgi:hypothetical protein